MKNIADFVERAPDRGMIEQVVEHPRRLRTLPRKDERDAHDAISVFDQSLQGSSPSLSPSG